MLAPLCVMAVPLYDFCTVILIRLSQRRSPFHGDKSHFSHRLVELGMRPAHAVLTIHLTTAMTGLGGLLLYKVPDWAGATLVVALIFCVLAIIAILETVGRRSVIGMQETLTEVRAAQTTIAEQISEQSQLDGRTLPLKQLPELATTRDHTGLRCVVELSVKELNDDWVLLNVLPQIHTGAATTRLSITGASEQLPVRQNVISLYEHQFTVKLLAGEIAVIGRNESSEWNLGRLFFQPEAGSSGSEKLLMIRMVGVDRLKGKSDPSFRLDAYEQ